MTERRLTRWIVALPVAVLLAWLALVMGAWSLAEARVAVARLQIDGWEARAERPRPDEWFEVKRTLDTVLDRRSQDPNAHELLARLYAIAATAAGPEAGRPLLRNALMHSVSTTRLRPSSPYSWVSVAMTKARLDEFDTDFHLALERAAALGPWEPPVLLELSRLALQHWDRLAAVAASQQALRDALRRMETGAPHTLLKLARELDRLPRLCALEPVSAFLVKACTE